MCKNTRMRAANNIQVGFAGKLIYTMFKRGRIKSFNISNLISVMQNQFQFPRLSCDANYKE